MKLCIRGPGTFGAAASSQEGQKAGLDASVTSHLLLEAPRDKPNQGPRARMPSEEARAAMPPGYRAELVMDLGLFWVNFVCPKKDTLKP